MDIRHIKNQAEASLMVDADLITIQDYISICKINGWDAASDTASDSASDESKSQLRLVWVNNERA